MNKSVIMPETKKIILTTPNKNPEVAGPALTMIEIDLSQTMLVAKHNTSPPVFTKSEKETNIELFQNTGRKDKRIVRARQYATNLHLTVNEANIYNIPPPKLKALQSIPDDLVPLKFMLEGAITAYLLKLTPQLLILIDESPESTTTDNVKQTEMFADTVRLDKKIERASEFISNLRLTISDLTFKGTPPPKFETLSTIPSDLLPLKFKLDNGTPGYLIRQNPTEVMHECIPKVDRVKIYLKKPEEVTPEDFCFPKLVTNVPATPPNLIGPSKLFKLVDPNTPTNIVETEENNKPCNSSNRNSETFKCPYEGMSFPATIFDKDLNIISNSMKLERCPSKNHDHPTCSLKMVQNDTFNAANSFVNTSVSKPSPNTPPSTVQGHDYGQDALYMNKEQQDFAISTAEKSNFCIRNTNTQFPSEPKTNVICYRSGLETEEEESSPHKEWNEESSLIHKHNRKSESNNKSVENTDTLEDAMYDFERFQVLVAVNADASKDEVGTVASKGEVDIQVANNAEISLKNTTKNKEEELSIRRSARLNKKESTSKSKYDCYYYY